MKGNVAVVAYLFESLVGARAKGFGDQLSSGPGLVEVSGLKASQALRTRSIPVVGIPADLTFAPLDGDATNVI